MEIFPVLVLALLLVQRGCLLFLKRLRCWWGRPGCALYRFFFEAVRPDVLVLVTGGRERTQFCSPNFCPSACQTIPFEMGWHRSYPDREARVGARGGEGYGVW